MGKLAIELRPGLCNFVALAKIVGRHSKGHTFGRVCDRCSIRLASGLVGVIELFTDLHGSGGGPRKDGAKGTGLIIGELQVDCIIWLENKPFPCDPYSPSPFSFWWFGGIAVAELGDPAIYGPRHVPFPQSMDLWNQWNQPGK